VATYEFRCDRHGRFDVSRPLGTAPASVPCAACGSEAKRVYSAPALFRGPRPVFAAMDRAEKSRDEPEVVTSLPVAGARRRPRMAPPDPRFQGLPRP
jgi:putative FmdB family regulatory protein